MRKFLAICLVMLPNYCIADIVTSSTDAFEGATILDSNSANIDGAFGVANLFNGADPEVEGATNTIFPDVGTGNFNFVDFAIDSAVDLEGLRLSAATDGATLSRALDRFRFLADTDSDGIFETVLIDEEIDPNYANQVGNVGTALGELDLTFNFDAINASQFRAEFFEAGGGTFAGVRVNELDAIVASATAVPEPASAACLLPLIAFGMIKRRRK